jgi:hypothetical protein
LELYVASWILSTYLVLIRRFEAPFQEQEGVSSADSLCAARFENSAHYSSTVLPIAEQDEDPSDGGGSSKDLFGSSPFNSGSFPFSTTSPSEVSSSVHQKPYHVIKPQSEPHFCSQDLFGAVPFSEMSLVKQTQEINLPRPTTLPLTVSQTPVRENVDIKHRSNSKEKVRCVDNSKYHLIEDCHEKTKLSHKLAAPSSFKKGLKKVVNDKASNIAAAAFSNMSFEDFPSDEENEASTEPVVAPFEVIRDEGEKKCGSLKRRSNPFS